MKIESLEKIVEFFEISANVNFTSVIPYIGSAGFFFYNIVDGPNKHDFAFMAATGASLIVGLVMSSVSYFIYREVSRDIKGAEKLAESFDNEILKSAIAYYKRRKAEGKEK